MNAQADTTILDLDELMDMNLDAVEDVPDFCEPDNGLYMLSISDAEIKRSKDKTKPSRIVLTYKIHEILECDGLPVPLESLYSEGFQGTAEGLKYFKKAAKALLNTDDLTGITTGQILEGLKELDPFKAKVTKKVTKKDNTEYININTRPIHGD